MPPRLILAGLAADARWFREPDRSMGRMIDAWLAKATVAGLTRCLTAAAVAFWRRHDGVRPFAIPPTLGIGLRSGLPLYLVLRSR